MAKTPRRIGVAVAGAALTACALYQFSGSPAPRATAQPHQAAPAAAQGLDPLTEREEQAAQKAAMADQPLAPSRAGRPDVAFLNASLLDYEGGAEGPRVAVVKLYDYRTDEMVVRRVDLASGRVTGTERGKSQQPGASLDEARRAVDLILADGRLGPGLRAQYQKAAGRPLRSVSDLHTRALIFRAAQASSAANAADFAQCGAHRCFMPLIGFPDGGWMDTRRVIVDMSAQRILILNPA
jgi:hypothetical protein